MNTHNFDAIKSETHNFELVVGQTYNFEATIEKTRQFFLILDEFKETSSLTVKIRNPIVLKIIQLKEKLFSTVEIRTQNRISLTMKLNDKKNVSIKSIIKIVANPSFHQHENAVIRTQTRILYFMKMILKIYDTKIISTNRITANPTLRQYYLLSVYDPELLEDLDTMLVQDMDYATL